MFELLNEYLCRWILVIFLLFGKSIFCWRTILRTITYETAIMVMDLTDLFIGSLIVLAFISSMYSIIISTTFLEE